MKTIALINQFISSMSAVGLPATIKIGTFEIIGQGSLHNWAGRTGEYNGSKISFQIVFTPEHIQMLLEMGVRIDLNSCKTNGLSPSALRFKQGREAIKLGKLAPYYYMGNPDNNITGYMDNWLIAHASCSLSVLNKLAAICRANHRDEIAIHNKTILKAAGINFKEKHSSYVSIETQYFNIKAIRKNANGKPLHKLLPIEKRVLKIN